MSEPSLISLLYSKRTKKEQTVINNFLLKNKIKFQPTHNVQKEYQAHIKINNLDQRHSSTELLAKSKSPIRNENNTAIKAPQSGKRSSPLKPNKNIENKSNTNSSKNLLERRKSSVDSNTKTKQPSQETARLEKKNIDSQTMTKLLTLVSMNNARVNNIQQEPESLQIKSIETEKTTPKESPKKNQKDSLIRQTKKIATKESPLKEKEEESLIKHIETSIDEEENIFPKKSISPVLDDLLWKIDLKLQSEASSPPNDSKLLASEIQNDYELPAQQEIVSLINLNSVEMVEEKNWVRANKDDENIEKVEVSRPTEEAQDDLLYKIQQSLRMVSFEKVEENEDDDESLPHFGAQRTTTKSFLTTRRETDENIFIDDQYQLGSDSLYKIDKNSPPKRLPEEQKNISNSPSKMSVATNLELFDSFDVEEFQRLQSQFDEKVSEFENSSPRKQLSTQEAFSREGFPQQNFLRSSSINTITRVTETLQTNENEELFNCYAYLLSQTQKPQKDYIPIIEEPSTQKPLKKKETMNQSRKNLNTQNQGKANERVRPKTPIKENRIPQSNHSRKSSTQYPPQPQKSPSNFSKRAESGISTARSRSNLKSNLKGTETNRTSVRSPTPPRSSRINTERKSRSPLDPALMNQNVNYDLMSSKNIVQHYQQLLKKLNNFPLHNAKS